ncbi:MAG: 8-oxo-dGTP diphosphatase [Clostridia bacterium]|nr:8-oxo-dGTP diphosphatase [Clostridia bacterium]
MERTTLAYLRRNEQYLMMHRTKKLEDINSGKWLGVGGHFEGDETPEQCIRREILEETGLMAENLTYCGEVFFDSDIYPPEIMYLFVCDDFKGELQDNCDEGQLKWVDQELLSTLPMWEGDKVFFGLIAEGRTGFRLHLRYEGDRLASYEIEDIK